MVIAFIDSMAGHVLSTSACLPLLVGFEASDAFDERKRTVMDVEGKEQVVVR